MGLRGPSNVSTQNRGKEKCALSAESKYPQTHPYQIKKQNPRKPETRLLGPAESNNLESVLLSGA